MKIVLIVAAMLVSSLSFAKSPSAPFVVKVCEKNNGGNEVNCQNRIYSYGKGAYNKSVIVCDRNSGGNDVNCGPRTYTFFKPRYETIEIRAGKDGQTVIGTYKRLTTGNYASWIGTAK